MTEIYTTGTWRPSKEAEAAFVDAWARFAEWASTMPGAGVLRLTRDSKDPGRFVSFGRWDTEPAVRAWKTHPEFSERMANVLQHVDDFQATELGVVATAESGASKTALGAAV